SVRYDHVLFTTEDGEKQIPLAEDDFYLSLAPYVDQTHECYYHNLAGCQGELVGEDLDVTITAADGEVLVDETVTTYDNGFVGFWLPRDIEGTIEVSFDGRSVTAPIATGPEDPTCVTTLQLT
ncbi:MAG: CueP family metal-binding protein, partial [Intrasporangiaceae bacterium]|nr:CueP family metal-binding protein [Intrasporangiaceae bacterium]